MLTPDALRSPLAGGLPRFDNFTVVGCQLAPAATTAQATSTGASTFDFNLQGGQVRLGEYFAHVRPQRVRAHYSAAQAFAVGYAQWFAVVLVIASSGTVATPVVVAGTPAVKASAALPTLAEIDAAVGDRKHIVLGHVRFHRLSDVVIHTAYSPLYRPDGAFTDDKITILYDTEDTSTLLLGPTRHINVEVDLAALSALSAGGLYVTGVDLGVGWWGGAFLGYEFIPSVAGAGAGADLTVRGQIGGTAISASDLNILLATMALNQNPSVACSARILPGDAFNLELEAKGTVFSAGKASLRVRIADYIAWE